MDVTVAVATFGDQSWIDLATRRAIPSAERLGVPVVHAHGSTLQEARNMAVALVESEWVIHLDADDELEAGYVWAMQHGRADLRAPSVRYVRNRHNGAPARVPKVAGHRHVCSAACLPEGNWLVIGTCVRTQLVRDVGGWRDFEWSEDWDLWLRCYLAGASIEALPKAVYRAWVRPLSRNRRLDQRGRSAAHAAIYRANFPQARAA